MPIEDRWDVKRAGRIFSRLSLGHVKRSITKGLIKEDDLIWHSGMSGWRKADESEELKPLFKKRKKNYHKRFWSDE